MSARDRVKKANAPLIEIKKPSTEQKTIISDVISNYNEHEETPEKEIEQSTLPESKPIIKEKSETEESKKGGRPVEFSKDRKQLKLLLPEEDYDFIKDRCGRYGGMTKYVIYLIEEEMKRAKHEYYTEEFSISEDSFYLN